MSSENVNAKAQAMGISLDEAEGIPTLEATENLFEVMCDRAAEFPISTREDAIDALMDAAAGTAALVGTLLAIAGTVDEQASAALIRASKEAANANMQTLRAIGYLNKCTLADRDHTAENATSMNARELMSRLEAIEDQLADAITDGDAWGGVDEGHPFARVIGAKNGLLDLIRDIEAEA